MYFELIGFLKPRVNVSGLYGDLLHNQEVDLLKLFSEIESREMEAEEVLNPLAMAIKM